MLLQRWVHSDDLLLCPLRKSNPAGKRNDLHSKGDYGKKGERMEYLNMVMGISTYLFTVTIIAAFRRGEGEGRSMFKYFIDFLFYSIAPLVAAAFIYAR